MTIKANRNLSMVKGQVKQSEIQGTREKQKALTYYRRSISAKLRVSQFESRRVSYNQDLPVEHKSFEQVIHDKKQARKVSKIYLVLDDKSQKRKLSLHNRSQIQHRTIHL